MKLFSSLQNGAVHTFMQQRFPNSRWLSFEFTKSNSQQCNSSADYKSTDVGTSPNNQSGKTITLKRFVIGSVLCLGMLFYSLSALAQCTGNANDCDGDGIVNTVDLDNDNDGILDADECDSANRISNGTFTTPAPGVNTIVLTTRLKVFAQDIPDNHAGDSEAFAQNITIHFGEKLSPALFDDPNMDHTTYTIKNHKSKILAKGTGKAVADFLYETPGQYLVEVIIDPALIKAHEGQCFHHSIPNKINVTVAAAKTIFLLDEMQFKNPLKGGVSQEGNILTIPVLVTSYKSKKVDMSNTKLQTAGVQALVAGYPSEKTILLPPGRHILEYKLQGTVNKDSYIMVDFTDNTGGIQSIGIKEKIK